MIKNKKSILLIVSFLLSAWGYAQKERDTIRYRVGFEESNTSNDSLINEIADTIAMKSKIYYTEDLVDFFEKLRLLEENKQGKINIVHIGDSHIQADFFSGRMRKLLQDRFGNGGFGFAFPYKLAKTNGSSVVRYSSNVDWTSYRNIYPVNGANVGLSGIALATDNKNLVIELSVRDSEYGFSRMKVFTPDNSGVYKLGLADKHIKLESSVPKKISHTIRNGESLSSIASKYKISVNTLKTLNKLKSNTIHAGKKLSIPTPEREPVVISHDVFTSLEGKKSEGFYDFKFKEELDKIYIFPDQESDLYDLNGVVLENSKAGIIYHTIGVNGAKFSDYNKYPLFFEQLKGLEADLVIVSMGTNEAFDRMSVEAFEQNVNEFLHNVKAQVPNVNILVTTPPPSYFSKGKPNTIASEYSNGLIINGIDNQYAIWDLYYSIGGTLGLKKLVEDNLLAKDLVHYTIKGYDYTGELFFQSLIEAYDNYINTRN
ncbi:LysM peptidoglycan-binding domain-containing protein [Myroides injenensis]|uniref:LysM peptidoglycan-binding domain-containing protein n=1 Tax=Myroides injenensis TaxID=1183151 RepID=UPI0022706A2C|nr:LysM peptidoglycan-binding domain-containing protein [Myroides injenensis]